MSPKSVVTSADQPAIPSAVQDDPALLRAPDESRLERAKRLVLEHGRWLGFGGRVTELIRAVREDERAKIARKYFGKENLR